LTPGQYRSQFDEEQVGEVWADRFEIRRRLGAGGLGVVYEAFDQDRQERVAIKTLLHVSANGLYSFKREFRSLADIQHPNLVRLGELIHDGQRWFFTMELLEGQNFVSYVRERPVQSPLGQTPSDQPHVNEARLRASLRQLVRGLLALHRAGLVHRDIKPSNLMITSDGRVVILDFGLVAPLSDNLLQSSSKSTVVGTVPYMAPEQGRGTEVGSASDWYSVGVLLYEVLSGTVPFTGSSVHLLLRKLTMPAPPLLERVCGVPDDLASLCMDLLETDPGDRPDASTIAASLGVSDKDFDPVDVPSSTLWPRPLSIEFVGREDELAVLENIFRAVEGRGVEPKGAAVFVTGAAGVGKTALIHRFLHKTASDKTLVLAGRCYERESVPYNGFDGIIDGLSHFLKGLSDAEAQDLLPKDAALLGRLFPVLLRVEAVYAASDEDRSRDDHDGSELRSRAFEALGQLLRNVTADHRIVLFVDDLQWADRESLELLRHICDIERGPGVLLVATLRGDISCGAQAPGNLEAVLECAPQAHLIELDNLAEEDTRRLAVKLWPGREQIDADAVERLVDETRGHPMLLRELVRHLSVIDASAVQGLSLAEILWRRVENLPGTERKLLELASVSGIPVELSLLASALDEPIGVTLGAAERLQSSRLLRVEKFHVTRQVITYHDRIREAVVAHLSDTILRGHHDALASAYRADESRLEDPLVLVEHLEQAGHGELAAHYTIEAAERASQAFAFGRAARLYRRALERGGFDDDERLRLQIELAEVVLNSGRSTEAAREFMHAADVCDEAPRRRELRRRAAEALLINGDIAGGLELYESVLADSGLGILSSKLGLMASTLWHHLRLKWRGLGFVPRDPQRLRSEQLERLELLSLISRQVSFMDPVIGFNYRVRALLLALELGHRPAIVEGVALQAVARSARGGEDAKERVDELLETANQMANTEAEDAVILGCRASISVFIGDFAQGFEELEASIVALDTYTTGSARVAGLNRVRTWRLKTLLELGRVAELRDTYVAFADEARRQGDHLRLMSLTRMAAVVWLLYDRPEKVEAALEKTPLYEPIISHAILHWYDLRTRGELALYRGEVVEQIATLTRQYKKMSRSIFARRFELSRIEVRWGWGRILLALVEAGEAARSHHKQLDEIIAQLRAETSSELAAMLADMLDAGRQACAGDDERAVELLEQVIAQADARQQTLYAMLARFRRDMLTDGQVGDVASAWFAAEGLPQPDRAAHVYLPGFGSGLSPGFGSSVDT
jgi:hypothetical protein